MSKASMIVLLVMILLAIIAAVVIGAFAYKDYKESEKIQRSASQVEIINSDSYRLVQNETNKWLNEHSDVIITSINIQCYSNGSEIHYCSTIMYKNKLN